MMNIKFYCQAFFFLMIGVIIMMVVVFNGGEQPKFLLGNIIVKSRKTETDGMNDGTETSCHYQMEGNNQNWNSSKIMKNVQEINSLDGNHSSTFSNIEFQIKDGESLETIQPQTDCMGTNKLVTINVGDETFGNYLHSHLVIKKQSF